MEPDNEIAPVAGILPKDELSDLAAGQVQPAGSPASNAVTARHWSDWVLFPPEGSTRELPRAVRGLNFALALLLIGLLVCVPFTLLRVAWNWAAIWKYREILIAGFGLTIVISVASLILSTVFGILSALAGRARFLPLRYANRVYIDLVRGTPVLVQILVLYYVTANALVRIFPIFNNRNVCGILILSFSYGAYISEVIRAGIESVGKSQLESAKAIGLTPLQSYRYVIFPQAIRQIMPSLAGQLVSLIKDSALLSVISVGEFTKNAKEAANLTYGVMECYIILSIGYLLLTLPISFLTRYLEKSTKFET